MLRKEHFNIELDFGLCFIKNLLVTGCRDLCLMKKGAFKVILIDPLG